MKHAMGNMSYEAHLRLEEDISKLTSIAKQAAAAAELEDAKKRSINDLDSGVASSEMNSDFVSHNTVKRYETLSDSVKNITNQLRVVLEGRAYF